MKKNIVTINASPRKGCIVGMRKYLLILLFFVAVSLSAQPGDQIVFSSVDLEGKPVSDAIFADVAVTMVNIWGTFCPPCIREMPDLGKLSVMYAGKVFQIVGIPIDIIDRTGKVLAGPRQDADRIIGATKASYRHIIPVPDMFAGMLRGVQAVPTTIFVDAEGHQIGSEYLGARSLKGWQKIIDSMLETRQ